MMDLMHLSTSKEGGINIIEASANYYHCIGTFLLNDRYGNRVDIIEGDKEEKIRKIYKKWMNENPHYSWTTLTECFRACKLNRLAYDIEQHFGLPSPGNGTVSMSSPYRGVQLPATKWAIVQSYTRCSVCTLQTYCIDGL